LPSHTYICDHEAAALIAEQVAALRNLRLVSYPVWGWTLPPATDIGEPVRAGWRLDIARHLQAKRRAIGAHRSQFGGMITDDPSQIFDLVVLSEILYFLSPDDIAYCARRVADGTSPDAVLLLVNWLGQIRTLAMKQPINSSKRLPGCSTSTRRNAVSNIESIA
jgi:hypothetical protein